MCADWQKLQTDPLPNSHRNGDAPEPWHEDGGYALRQTWL